MRRFFTTALALAVLGVGSWELGVGVLAAQAPAQTAKPAVAPPAATGVALPPDYVIGVDDVLDVAFWRDKDMSATVNVRPDGKVTLPLLNDIHAAGLTPEEFTKRVTEAASKLVEEPTVNVTVKTINSRKVYIIGQVPKPGFYPLLDTMTILQMLAIAGGPVEFADSENIRVVRTENGKSLTYRFNYKEISEGKNLAQNIVQKPGDTIVVP
jgi:polysaccharide export outer membrane protein